MALELTFYHYNQPIALDKGNPFRFIWVELYLWCNWQRHDFAAVDLSDL
ncbi:MAG: hypothetical protein JOZ78_07070 [Chroococcidiopsidaceae cyanobacterium CP_BM_ER_R8_30]|nr:hypothetical protein [Chroococcidiopsidaceae cyanobacterium CP_BM_ER_R8_30]